METRTPRFIQLHDENRADVRGELAAGLAAFLTAFYSWRLLILTFHRVLPEPDPLLPGHPRFGDLGGGRHQGAMERRGDGQGDGPHVLGPKIERARWLFRERDVRSTSSPPASRPCAAR